MQTNDCIYYVGDSDVSVIVEATLGGIIVFLIVTLLFVIICCFCWKKG